MALGRRVHVGHLDGHNLNNGPDGFEGTRLALDAGIRGAGPVQRARSAHGGIHVHVFRERFMLTTPRHLFDVSL